MAAAAAATQAVPSPRTPERGDGPVRDEAQRFTRPEQGQGRGVGTRCTTRTRSGRSHSPGAQHTVLRPPRRECARARWTAAGSSPGSWAAAGGLGRHAAVGFEVLLDVRVPQYAREVDEEPWSNLLKKVAALDRRREREKAQEKEAYDKKMWELNRKVTAGILVSAEEMAAWRRWNGLGPFSSMEGIKRKKRKRRKK